jgi:hypothetical protein
MVYLEDALAGERIAGDAYAVVVCSPHQNNFEMPFRVEVWDREPPEDEADWEEIFLCGLVVDDGGLSYQSPTMNETVFDVPVGTYAVADVRAWFRQSRMAGLDPSRRRLARTDVAISRWAGPSPFEDQSLAAARVTMSNVGEGA